VNFSYWWNNQGQDSNPRQFPYSGLTPGSQQTIDLSVTAPTTPGTYYLTFDNVNELFCWFRNNEGTCGPGNITYTSANITVNAPPTFNVTKTNVICFDEGNGTLTITVSGGTGPYDYRYKIDGGSFGDWIDFTDDDNDNVEVVSNLGPGTYTVEVQDDLGCPGTCE